LDKAIELCGKALSSLDLEQDTEFEIRVSRANLYERRWAYQKEQGTLTPRGIFTDIDLAILDWTKALEIDPDYIDGYNSRATAHYLNQNFEEATRDYSIAIARAPHNALYLKNRAVTFEKLNKPLEAEEDRKRALALNPSLQLDEEIAKKAQRLSPEYNYDLKQESKSNGNFTPPPEEYEDSEIARLSDMFNKQHSLDELNLKNRLERLQSTLAKTQDFNRELDSKLEALQQYYEKKNVERGLMVELLRQKLNSLNQYFKLLVSAYIAITVLDLIMALRKSGIDVFKDIWKQPKRFLHLILAITGMRFLFAKKPFSKIDLFQQ